MKYIATRLNGKVVEAGECVFVCVFPKKKKIKKRVTPMNDGSGFAFDYGYMEDETRGESNGTK